MDSYFFFIHPHPPHSSPALNGREPDGVWNYHSLEEFVPYQAEDCDEGIKVIQIMNHLSLNSKTLNFKPDKMEIKRKKI